MELSKSEKYLLRKGEALPTVTPNMAHVVSQYRREGLEEEMHDGKFSVEGSGGRHYSGSSGTPLGNVVSSSHVMKKYAASFTSDGGSSSGYRGSSDTYRQVPEVYSPLWLNSNLNLPRDRATINAWARSFFALNPIVQNAISLHATYPISKLNIKCKNPEVNAFFENMIDEIDLENICVQIAQEYWTLGEAFVYAELNESTATWSRLLIQNPDYITVKNSVIAGEPIISLRPDENLRRICTGNTASDIQQRQQLDRSIVEHVRKGRDIPLSNFYASHIARKIAPYEVRGTGLPVSCFRQLMLFDKLRECYSTDCEVLTTEGFKRIDEITEISTDVSPTPGYVNGIQLDESGNVAGVLKLKEGIKVACFNKDTEELEYHVPEELHMSKYTGKMLHFNSSNMDVLVTPNHKMWASQRHGKEFGEYDLIRASEFDPKKVYKFRSVTNWTGKDVEFADVAGHKIPIDVYLTFLGHTISEGCVDTGLAKSTGYYRSRIAISQNTSNETAMLNMRNGMDQFAAACGKKVSHEVAFRAGGFSNEPRERWMGTFSSKKIVGFIKEEIGFDGLCDAQHKRIPRWVLQLPKERLLVLLDALMAGDGTLTKIQVGTSYRYSTSCKRLSDDVQELAFKCGRSVFISSAKRDTCIEYTVRWSDSDRGAYPQLYHNGTKLGSIDEVDYDDAVWCLTVPTGLFVTRRNNRITIQGNSKFSQADNMINPLTLVKIGGGADNYKPTPADLEQWRQIFEESQYDKDFKIFTHDGVNVERVGFGQGIYDISGDVTQLLKEIYIGLLVPQVIMDGGADVTYANGGVALDVLRQRYMQFRNTLSSWLRRKIFAPISKINDFYDIVDGEKVLIVPTVEWNHMSLFDMGDYIQNLSQLLSQEPRKVSVQTLYKSLGLEYEDEQRKIRRENIDQIIAAKEMEAMQRMSLNDLRSIGEEDEIQEITESPLPGEQALDPAQPGGLPGMPGGDLGMGGPGMGGGGLIPPMPPMGGGMGGPPPPMGGPPGGGGGGPPPPAGL